MAETIEIDTGRERRRRWSIEDKLRMAAASYEAVARVKQVVASHDVYLGLLLEWRRRAYEGTLARASVSSFLPVRCW